MRTFGASMLLLVAAAATCRAQQWEFGGVGGGGFLSTVGVAGLAGSATAGFQTGAAFGAFFGHNAYSHVGGELRYAYLQSNLQLSSGGSTVTFAGMSHVVHYDLILRAGHRGSPVQFFAAIGGGMKIFRGTGAEAAYQPLSQFGYFTKTQVLKPMASVGGGMKYFLTRKVCLRTEVRDYITAFPTELIAPAPGAKFGSILHDLVPMVGLSYEF
ncbi:MAG: hypothetical protein ABSH44_00355 [Bryobacteraceae bacterium]